MKIINIQRVTTDANLQVVAGKAGETLRCWYMVGCDPGVGTITYVDGGPAEVLFNCDFVAVVQSFNPRKGHCKHLRFVRTDRHAGGLTLGAGKAWPKLRKAMQFSGCSPVTALGGFQNILVYRDEMAVWDFSMSGSRGWIVPKQDIGKYLAALPPEPMTPGDLAIRFECRSCGRFVKLGFAVERLGVANKVWSILPASGQICSCGEDFATCSNYEVITLNGHSFTGHSLVQMERPEDRAAFEEKWLQEVPPQGDPDPWILAISAGCPINNFGYGGSLVPTSKK